MMNSSTVSASAALAQSVSVEAAASVLITPSRKQARRHRILNATTILIAVTSIIVSAVAMYWAQAPLVYLAFSMPMFVTAPLILFNKVRLKGLPPLWLLRQTQMHIRTEVNRLGVVNGLFSNEITRLEEEHRKLRGVEERLEKTVAHAGADITTMRRLLTEYAQIQREMKRLMKAEELQQLMAALLHSDTNKDGNFSKQEIDMLLIRLKAFNVVDRNRLRTVLHMASSKSLKHVYQAAAEEFNAYDCADIGDEDEEEGGVMAAFDYIPWAD